MSAPDPEPPPMPPHTTHTPRRGRLAAENVLIFRRAEAPGAR